MSTTYTTATTLRGESRGSAAAFYGYAVSKGSSRLPDVKQYLETLDKLCRSNGISFEVAVAQSIHETSESGVPWASYWWKQRVNPAGIGITGDPVQNQNSRNFGSGDAAARCHFLHLFLYAVGTSIPTGLSKADDPRWQAAVDAGYAGIAKTINDLTNRWGVDNQYAAGVVKWLTLFDSIGLLGGAEIPDEPEKEPDVAETIVFGRVPAPEVKKIDTSHKPEGVGWDNLGQRKPKFVVLHRMVGSLAGTDSWFAQPDVPSLTDFGIGIAAMDGSSKSGEIHQYNDSRGTRSGWASGPYNGAYGDGKAIVDKYGINVINRDGESLEISGNYETAITDSEKQRIAEWIAWRWDLMKIPYTSAPINPETGISAVMFHQEFTLGSGKICPGPVVMNAVQDLIDRATAILKKYQVVAGDGTGGGTTTPAPDKPATPSDIGFQKELGKQPYYTDDATVWFNGVGRYVASKDTPALKYAVAGSGAIRTIKKGETVVEVAHGVSKTDNKPYILTAARERVLMDDLQYVPPVEGE